MNFCLVGCCWAIFFFVVVVAVDFAFPFSRNPYLILVNMNSGYQILKLVLKSIYKTAV